MFLDEWIDYPIKEIYILDKRDNRLFSEDSNIFRGCFKASHFVFLWSVALMLIQMHPKKDMI